MIDDVREGSGSRTASGDDFLNALDEQLASTETPEVKAELTRLLGLGLERDEARKVMAVVLSLHIVRMLKRKQPFDYPGYLADLRSLPKLPVLK